MTRSGWRQGLGDLARDVMRVLFIYALVLQTLAPVATARAEAREGIAAPSVLCSAMVGAGIERPAKAPLRIVHDCLSCCLGSAVAVLTAPTELPEPTRFSLLLAPAAPRALVLPVRADRPPSQRAPPPRLIDDRPR